MKRILLITITLLAFAFTSSAQGWRRIDLEKDELTKAKAQTVWLYEDADGNKFYYYTKSKLAIVTCADGIFDYYTIATGDFCKSFVGFYDNGVMVSRKRTVMPVSRSSKNANFGNFSKRIYKWLLEPNHSIRIVIPRFDKSNLDMTVTEKIDYKGE